MPNGFSGQSGPQYDVPSNWADVVVGGFELIGDIFGKKNKSSKEYTAASNTQVQQFGGSNWWDDLFGGGSTVNIFGMEVPRTVIILGVLYLIFGKKLKRLF